MQFLKSQSSRSPLPFILAGATALSLVVTLPALIQPEVQSSTQITSARAATQTTADTPDRFIAIAQRTDSSVDPWEIGWAAMAGLGFLSGVSSLAIIYWWLRPHRLDARKRLRALESKLKDMEKYQLEINTIKRGLVEREASTTQKLLSINKQLAASQAGFREQLSKHDNLISTVTAKLIPPEPSALGLHPTPPPVSPADEVTADYSAAVQRNDRATIRELTVAGLNITQESEEAMTRGTSTSRTQLQVVTGGGSYLLIQRGGRHWLCPTAQTLESFTTNKPQKGIYDYEEQTSISFAELKKPAEVMQVDEGIWEVISKGIVLAPI